MAYVNIDSIETTLFHGSIERTVYDIKGKGFDVSYSHDGGKILRRHRITVRGGDRDIAKLLLLMTRMGYIKMSGDQLDEATRYLSTEDIIAIYKEG